MDQLEAEISGKAPLPSTKTVLSKSSNNSKKESKNRTDKVIADGDDEIELVQVKTGKEPGAIIEIRESISPDNFSKNSNATKPPSSPYEKNSVRRSRSPFRSRSRSPFSLSRNHRRSRSPYWSKSPLRSRSPFRRSRSPFWSSRRSRSSSRKSRSPYRRYRSPNRKRSPYTRFSRSRSKSYERRRSPWSFSPRRRSKSPLFREGSPFARRRNFNSPNGRIRRSFSPREGSRSPRRRSRSPRRFIRNSPFHRSKSPFRRSKSPLRRSSSPYLHRSKSPINNKTSPPYKRIGNRRSKTPIRRGISPPGRRPKSSDRSSPKRKSKSPIKKGVIATRKSPKRKDGIDDRNFSFSTSPTPRKNRSPLRVVEKNKLESTERNEKSNERGKNEKRLRSLSRENRKYDRRSNVRSKNFRRISPNKNVKSSDVSGKGSKSPKQKSGSDENGKDAQNQGAKETDSNVVASGPTDSVLEARKKKFESLNEVDPTVDKKISLKSIKESNENNDEDEEDALTINLESNLWDDSEESGDEFESRFKSSDPRKNNSSSVNRTVLSFRNLREGDNASRKIFLNKPLTQENTNEKSNRDDRRDRWRRNNKNDSRKSTNMDCKKSRNDNLDKNRGKNNSGGFSSSSSLNSGARGERRTDRKPIFWSKKDEFKSEKNLKDNEVSTTQSDLKMNKLKKNSESKIVAEQNDGGLTQETDDFDKLISDFEKELENDICLTPKIAIEQTEPRKSKVSVKRGNFIESKSATVDSIPKKTMPARTVKINEATSKKTGTNEPFDKKKVLVSNISRLRF